MLAGRERQSARTGLIHGIGEAADTISIYENGCFVLALLSQCKIEEALEARALLLRLLAFQTEGGEFPIYLHEFPKCHDPMLGLKIAPLWLRALIDFPHAIGAECKEALRLSLSRIFAAVNDRPLKPLWQLRYSVCLAVFEGRVPALVSLDTCAFSASDWWEYWLTLQFVQTPTCDFYHAGLQKTLGPFLGDAPELIDWACGRPSPLPPVALCALRGVEVLSFNPNIPGYYTSFGEAHALLAVREARTPSRTPMRLLWQGHSACLEVDGCLTSTSLQDGSLFLKIELPHAFELAREALFEISFFVDVSPDIAFFIEGKKGTAFALGDTLLLQSNSLQAQMAFELLDGEGDFCGHIFRANLQTHCWKIALRTLRRSSHCSIGFRLGVVAQLAVNALS